MSTSIGHKPSGDKWAFDEEVTQCFGDMLERSIPDYAEMRRLTAALAGEFIQPDTDILDIGCSDGRAMTQLGCQAGCRFIGLEVSEPMRAKAVERLRSAGIDRFDIRDLDLRRDFPGDVQPSVALSVLTLQFIPIEYRQALVSNIFRCLLPGGAFVVVEKVLGASAPLNDLLVAEYYAMKERNGYSADDIDRKRLSLEGVLVPVTAAWNVDMLRSAGFTEVECYWRWGNFAAWLAVKP